MFSFFIVLIFVYITVWDVLDVYFYMVTFVFTVVLSMVALIVAVPLVAPAFKMVTAFPLDILVLLMVPKLVVKITNPV